ncbi:MAG: hypothetical protein IJT16_06570 [Lachnospiraceae bacterium]|nr:hypothetical protein [Lachnospiraceae bacterium]MBR2274996.1 hypothetical protein [Lachnospiraceae bacterium]
MADEKNTKLNDEAMAKAAGGAGRSDEYDMYGFVVEKLPAEQYANHYNVKGDNDEIFICWYAGDDILAAGTEVGMTHIPQDNGWKIEPIMHI